MKQPNQIEAEIVSDEESLKSVSFKLPMNFIKPENSEDLKLKFVASQERLTESFKTFSESFSEKFIPAKSILPANDNVNENQINATSIDKNLSENMFSRTNERIIEKLNELVNSTRSVFDGLTSIRKGDEGWRKEQNIERKKNESEKEELRNESDDGIPVEKDGNQKSLFKKLSSSMLQKSLFTKMMGSALIGGTLATFIPGLVSKIFGTLRMWLPNFLGSTLDAVEGGVSSGKWGKNLGKVMKGVRIAGGLLAIGTSIYSISQDILQSEILSKKWKTSKLSTMIGAGLGSTKSGWMNAFKQSGKYAILGAGSGFAIGGPPGAILGGIVGGIVGGLLGLFGGAWIARKIDSSLNVIKRFSDKVLGTSFILNEGDLRKSKDQLKKDIDSNRIKLKKNLSTIERYDKLLEVARIEGNRYQIRRLKFQLKYLKSQNVGISNDIKHFESEISQINEDIKGVTGKWRTFLRKQYDEFEEAFIGFKYIFTERLSSLKDGIFNIKKKVKGFFTDILVKIGNFSIKDFIFGKKKKVLQQKMLPLVESENGKIIREEYKETNFQKLRDIVETIKSTEKHSFLEVKRLENEKRFTDKPTPAKTLEMSKMFDEKKSEKKQKQSIAAISTIGSMNINSGNRSSSTTINPISSFNQEQSLTRMRNRYIGGDKR